MKLAIREGLGREGLRLGRGGLGREELGQGREGGLVPLARQSQAQVAQALQEPARYIAAAKAATADQRAGAAALYRDRPGAGVKQSPRLDGHTIYYCQGFCARCCCCCCGSCCWCCLGSLKDTAHLHKLRQACAHVSMSACACIRCSTQDEALAHTHTHAHMHARTGMPALKATCKCRMWHAMQRATSHKPHMRT